MVLNQYTLITGAASDLGKAFALRFAREGYHLVLTDSEAAKLLQVESEVSNLYPSTIIIVIPKDFSVASAAEELYEEIREEGVIVSVLVNLTGPTEAGLFAETNWIDEEKLITGNVYTSTRLIKLILREMLSRENGKILQVISTSSFIHSSRRAVYGATQSFLLFFSDALQHELGETPVTLTILSQGISESKNESITLNPGDASDVRVVDLNEIAATGHKALMQGKKHEIAGFSSDQVGIDQLIPESWSTAIMNKMNDEKNQG
jgi:uncharacterized protein